MRGAEVGAVTAAVILGAALAVVALAVTVRAAVACAQRGWL